MSDWRHAIERRLEGLRLPPTREAEVVEELSQHLDDRYRELRAAGASETTARREALAELDDADLVRELTGVEARAVEPLSLGSSSAVGLVSSVMHDIRFGARLLVKERGASVVIVATLALAIAANAIVFGIADLVLLRPLPLGNEKRMVTIYGADPQVSHDRQRVSLIDYLEIKAQSTSFEDVVAMRRDQQLSLTGAGEPRAVSAAFATANIFDVWNVRAVAGRGLHRDGGDGLRNQVVVLAHHFWTGHFNADPAVVGRSVMLNGRSYTVVGVITPDIEIGNLAEIDLWVPLDTAAATDRESRTLIAQGLLQPGATLEAANAELATIADRLARAYPALNKGWRLFAITLRASTVGPSAWVILALLSVVVALVLIVACANVATVMLARASARRREIAVRLALGATRGRLVRQLVSENMILGLASGAVGLLFAHEGLVAFKVLSPETFWQRLEVNGHLLAFGFALSVAAPLLFGVVPGLQSSRPDLNEDLKEGGRDASLSVRGNRSRSVLVVAQVAFALAVLIVCGLIVRTVVGLERVPLGMNPDGVLTTRIRFDPPKYDDDAGRLRAVESILDRLSAVPGVTAAAAMRSFPVVDGEPRVRFAIAGRPAAPAGSGPWAAEAATYGEYGKTIGLPLVDGRTWNAGDRAGGWTVALVNREAVRRYWPSQSPVGARITMLDAEARPVGAPIDIIGVVDNVIGGDPSEPPPPRVYRPLPSGASLESVGFAVRASGDASSLAPSIRAALRAEDRDLAVSDVRPARRELDDTTRTNTLIVTLFASFAAIGLVVAITGVYGVTAFSVGQRRHEIGVRIALGASGPDVMRLIAGRSLRLIGAGAAFGVLVGWGIGLAMRNVLFGVGAADPLTYAAVLGVVGVAAAIATYLPAHRAIAIDPMAVLKRE